jgi:hypothetical protein
VAYAPAVGQESEGPTKGVAVLRGLRQHLTYANVVATLALLFAMTGGAIAAKHYLINSTRQINPKVLKVLKGKTGAAGPQGAAGPRGLAGSAGSPGIQGKEGERGPSDVYEVTLSEPTTSSEVPQTIELPPLPAGEYAIYGKGSISIGGNKAANARCELATNFSTAEDGEQYDLAIDALPETTSTERYITLNTQLTGVFTETGFVSLRCRMDNAGVMFGLTTNPPTRLIAVRVGSLHRSRKPAT